MDAWFRRDSGAKHTDSRRTVEYGHDPYTEGRLMMIVTPELLEALKR